MKRDPLPLPDSGHGTPGDPVTRILRVSRARVQGSAMEHLFAARRRVLGPARVPGLCGAALHVAGWYVLWQEGPEEAVEEALRATLRKRQPEPQRTIHRSIGRRTLSEPLAVSTTQWAEDPAVFERRIAIAADAGLQPQQAWRLLSEPSTLAGPGEPVPPDGRVGLLASADARAIELARGLAEHFRRPLVYRRFAGGDPASSDVGTAYFDLLVGGRPLRVQAATRRAFAHALVHASLGRPERLALLPGSAERAALDLAVGVTAFLRGGSAAPSVDLVADAPDVAAAVRDLLERVVGADVQVHEGLPSDSQIMALLLGLGPQRAS